MLEQLTDDILITVLSYLDVPDIFVLAKTSQRLRELSTCSIVHHYRLWKLNPVILEAHLKLRPSFDDLVRWHVVTVPVLPNALDTRVRSLSRALIRSRLEKNIKQRPPLDVLIERNILPSTGSPVRVHSSNKEALSFLNRSPSLSPILHQRAVLLERERKRNFLEQWVRNDRPSVYSARKFGVHYPEMPRPPGTAQRMRRLVRLLKDEKSTFGSNKGRKIRSGNTDPPKAKVHKLTCFWECKAQQYTVQV